MPTQSPDTPPEIEQILIEGYRRMTPARKLECIRQLTLAIQELALAGIRSEHPRASERECELRLASRRLPAEIMKRVFDWDVHSHGY